MLGRWCYEIANLTWLQRKIVKCLYHTEPPTSSYDEAYKHLLKAEELRPRSFLPNLFVLGQVCFKLGFYYSAKYYLEMALTLSTRSDAKKWEHFRNSAKSMLKKLKNYDMGRELLSERKT
ncbi:regulator of microtubule dynamics protein 1-like [Cylas formicarius]|uniref:regulator of microtubule dynamics protein 1-like n=1 Tax=Cylas formicarius TaxID=197179 RepID=UPI002958613F|nr:regulator of microtubule dynamics protein 1-like [Cylas formicarius]